MRDKNQNFIQFYKQVGEVIAEKLTHPRLLRTTVSINPKVLSEFRFCYPRKFKEVQGLCLIHWWLPESIKWRVHLDLWDLNKNHFNSKQQIEISLLLESKEICFKYLYKTKRYSKREIFGNLLRTGLNSYEHLRITPKETKVEKPQRARGYRDKGSLRPVEKWLPVHDHTLTAIQNEKEMKVTLRNKSINRLIKYLNEND